MTVERYHVVVAFDRNEEGNLVGGRGVLEKSKMAALSTARDLARTHLGVVAVSCLADREAGVFGEGQATIFGVVPAKYRPRGR
ncbi:hypothetical protein [Terrarubrum flagellatum]|uniref:hypothetical protein n=1 Tax=Terrirubrum flagellatum TaxID=2895980 RepID=UPI00314554DD